MVGVQGFEPWTLWSQTRCATGLRYTPKILWWLGEHLKLHFLPYEGSSLPLKIPNQL
jgi:hypothetical protein